VQQIAASIATRLRTVDAAAIDEALLIDTEQALMRLSDAVSAAYLTNNERSETAWGALA
jgi:3-deoxy-D-arabino-heptulosonate 7-phosphate (DAHP) synthase class II